MKDTRPAYRKIRHHKQPYGKRVVLHREQFRVGQRCFKYGVVILVGGKCRVFGRKLSI